MHFIGITAALVGHVAAAQPLGALLRPARDTCLSGIVAAEQKFALPQKLLQTIGIVESGRADPVTGRVTPWPWTINAAGTGHFYETKAAAIKAVQDLQEAGTRSIDVGCLQINLVHHPAAFSSLDEAFDPVVNTRYGGHFLSDLYQETGKWPLAAAAYHSRTQEIGASYAERVMAMWPLANRFTEGRFPSHDRRAVAPDLSLYTPEFAAEVKRQRASYARLLASAGSTPKLRQLAATPARPTAATPRNSWRNERDDPFRRQMAARGQ